MTTKQLFICDCHSPEHQFIVESWFDDDIDFRYLIFHVHLTPLPFWRRLVRSFKYVFGINTYHFEEVLLRPPKATELRDAIDKFLILAK